MNSSSASVVLAGHLALLSSISFGGFRSDAKRDADDIRSRHKLAEGQDFGEFLIVQPTLLFDDDAARPDEPAAKPEERDLQEV